MPPQSSPELDRLLADWRRQASRRGLSDEQTLDELESHLLDEIDRLHQERPGLTERQAFFEAAARLGHEDALAAEYGKVAWARELRRQGPAYTFSWRIEMLRNYAKTAVRSLLRHKGYSFINLAGLTVGLASCLVIFQYVAFEYSFDRFHENERDLYRVTSSVTRDGNDLGTGADTPFGLGPALAESVPEILHAARLHAESAVMSTPLRPTQVYEENRVLYTDPAFLKMFTFPLVAGTAEEALKPGTILLSRTAARKYFGAADPIGQVLDVAGETEKSYRVTGVFRDVPATSHLQFDFLLPIDDLLRTAQYNSDPRAAWGWNNFATYIQLDAGARRDASERKMTEVVQARRGKMYAEMGFSERAGAQPLRDIHLNIDLNGPFDVVAGSYRTVYFFTVVGLITLLIALINYVNLATARAIDRAREVGVRKVMGAQRRQLVTQFLCESALTNLVAAGLAALVAVALSPLVSRLVGAELGVLWTNPAFWAAFLGTLAVCSLLAGLYPAFVLSSFKPVSVLKGKAGSFAARLWLRRGLVVLQFAAAVVLVAGTAVVYNQLGYMRRMDLGLDLEQVLTVEGPRVLSDGADTGAAMTIFVEEARRIPGVREVATSSTLPGQGFEWEGAQIHRAEDDPAGALEGVVTFIDTSFASLYGLALAAGNGFREFTPWPGSEAVPLAVIANETAVRSLGFAAPEDAMGHALKISGYDALIVGVFKDFNWSSAHEPRQNVLFGRTVAGNRVSLRVGTEDLPGTIAAVEGVYHRLFPGNVFQYGFADEAFELQYRNDERFATLFTLFAGLAIAIACLGLFGLASFTARQRTKEIGVRKVLGATVLSLVVLLSRDFLKLVLVAVVIAAPVAYFLMRRWLEGFAYRVEVGAGVLVLSGVIALAIALATVSYQALKAAVADPVKSLRYE